MQRRTRVHCRVPCQISQGRTRSKAMAIDLSDGGLAIATRLVLQEGDDIRITLYPHRKTGSIVVHGIVWSLKRRTDARGRPAPPVVGVMVSKPPRPYRALVAKLESLEPDGPRLVRSSEAAQPTSARAELRQPSSWVTVVSEPEADGSLPRPKDPLPPPKKTDPEALPLFVIRVKQQSGTRTRRLKLRCTSVHDVERRVRKELGEGWEILEVTSISES